MQIVVDNFTCFAVIGQLQSLATDSQIQDLFLLNNGKCNVKIAQETNK